MLIARKVSFYSETHHLEYQKLTVQRSKQVIFTASYKHRKPIEELRVFVDTLNLYGSVRLSLGIYSHLMYSSGAPYKNSFHSPCTTSGHFLTMHIKSATAFASNAHLHIKRDNDVDDANDIWCWWPNTIKVIIMRKFCFQWNYFSIFYIFGYQTNPSETVLCKYTYNTLTWRNNKKWMEEWMNYWCCYLLRLFCTSSANEPNNDGSRLRGAWDSFVIVWHTFGYSNRYERKVCGLRLKNKLLEAKESHFLCDFKFRQNSEMENK